MRSVTSSCASREALPGKMPSKPAGRWLDRCPWAECLFVIKRTESSP